MKYRSNRQDRQDHTEKDLKEYEGEGRIDMWVDQRSIVELKAIERFEAIHQAQLSFYLKATQCFLGLLINFNVLILKQGIRRVVLSK